MPLKTPSTQTIKSRLWSRLRLLFQGPAPYPHPADQAQSAPTTEAPRAAKPSSVEKHVFYIALRQTPTPSPLGPNSIPIFAEAFYQIDAEGKRQYGSVTHAGADAIDLCQANSAIARMRLFEAGKCSHKKAVQWIRHTEQAVGKKYLNPRGSEDLSNNELSVFRALSTISMELLLANLEASSMPSSAISLIREQMQVPRTSGRFSNHKADGQRIMEAHDMGNIDPEFMTLARHCARMLS